MFESFATGIDLIAEHDGTKDEDVGIFLSNVEANNDLTVTFTSPPDKAGKVDYEELSNYIKAKGFLELSSIGSGEGFWVNAKDQFPLRYMEAFLKMPLSRF